MAEQRPTSGERTSVERNARQEAVGVLTVDDQAVFRDLARLVLQATPGFKSVGEAGSGEEALEVIGELKPELVLVDVRMPGMGGIETARRLCSAHPESVVVLISIEDPGDLPPAAEASGAMALVRKQEFGPAMLRDLWARYGPKE
jgi:two-component system, NarL family, invasion response regulator UvrY